MFIVAIGPGDERASRALRTFKASSAAQDARFGRVRLCLLSRAQGPLPTIVRDPATGRWLASAGTWLHPAAPRATGPDLLRWIGERGLRAVARELEGMFALVIGGEHDDRVDVVTDRCGTCHAFTAASGGTRFVSTSSAALGTLTGGRFDPVALRSFVATGIVYGERSLWDGVRKLPPASITTVGARVESQRYWSFAEIEPERDDIDVAAERLGDGLADVARRLGERFDAPACDVTGGYDSRACLSGFLAAGVPVDAAVSGPPDSADVRVSKVIADRFGLAHRHTFRTRPPSIAELDASVRLTDGEYDAFEYARIRDVHVGLAAGHDVSINGSFGEIARGYWWELLFPRVGARRPLDVAAIVSARFLAAAAPTPFLDGAARVDLRDELVGVAAAAVAPLAGFPNTTQLDALYYALRMQRWQGRIASATDQIWPCLSPFAFPTLLVPMLEARASARMGSRLVREMLDRRTPALAALDLEHGYPAQPLRASNVHRFLPMATELGGRVLRKAARTAAAKAGLGRRADGPPARRTQPLVAEGDDALRPCASVPRLADTGLFVAERLVDALSAPLRDMSEPSAVWCRLMTLEQLLRTVDVVDHDTSALAITA